MILTDYGQPGLSDEIILKGRYKEKNIQFNPPLPNGHLISLWKFMSGTHFFRIFIFGGVLNLRWIVISHIG